VTIGFNKKALLVEVMRYVPKKMNTKLLSKNILNMDFVLITLKKGCKFFAFLLYS